MSLFISSFRSSERSASVSFPRRPVAFGSNFGSKRARYVLLNDVWLGLAFDGGSLTAALNGQVRDDGRDPLQTVRTGVAW